LLFEPWPPWNDDASHRDTGGGATVPPTPKTPFRAARVEPLGANAAHTRPAAWSPFLAFRAASVASGPSQHVYISIDL